MVTGSDSGIGQAIAITVAREGADVVVHYGHDVDGAWKTAHEIERRNRRAVILQAELADPRNAQGLFEQATAQLGNIDILDNNAGTSATAATSLDVPLDEFIRVINVDMVSARALAQAAARQMVERGGGVIINVTSVHEEVPRPGGAPYDTAAGTGAIGRAVQARTSPFRSTGLPRHAQHSPPHASGPRGMLRHDRRRGDQ